jgi:hypothetical protein
MCAIPHGHGASFSPFLATLLQQRRPERERRRRNRCRKKLEIARAAKSLTPQENKMHTKDTRASVRVLDGPLEFWNVKPTELGIMFFLSVFGAEWIGVFKAIYWRLGWLCFENLGMLL